MASIIDKIKEAKQSSDFQFKELMGYASGSFGYSMGRDSVGTYADQFLYDHMGLQSGPVIALKSVTKIVNIVSAPIVGALIDNAKPGKNRTRTFMAMAAIPLTLSSVMLFTVPSDSLMFRIIWTFLFFLLFNVTDTLYDVSLLTMSARMIEDPKARKSFYTVAEFASTLGSMLPGWVLPIIVQLQKNDYNKERLAFFMVALIFGILGLITMMVPCFTLRERVIAKAAVEKKASIDLKLIFLNKPLMLLCLSQIIDSVRQVCYGSLPFFYKKTLNRYGMKSIVEAGSGALSYTCLALVPLIGKKLSSRDMVSFGYLWTGICYIILLIVGYKNPIIAGVLIAIAGMPNAAMSAARKILMADSTDYMEWKSYKKFGTAVRNEGMVFSFNSMAHRISGLWKDLMLPFGLKIIGYKSAEGKDGEVVEAIQTPKTLKGIFLLVVIPGIVGNILPGLIMRFDDFNGKKKEKIMEELVEIRKLSADMKDEISKMENEEVEA